MKVLIVDDESIVRLGMRYIVPWEENGYQVVGEASNGEEALTLAKIHRPDIVLIDIIMPKMDGLECVEKIKLELPFAKFIILSCRDDVAFYRKAIKLGVSEYIQKSLVSPTEMLEAVDHISVEIRSKKIFDGGGISGESLSQRQITLSEFFNMLLKGQITDQKSIIDKLNSYGIAAIGKALYVISFVAEFTGKTERQYDGEYDASIINIAQGILNDMAEGHIFLNHAHWIVAVIFCEADYSEHEQVQNLFYRIQETITQLFFIRLTAGVSRQVTDCTAIHQGLMQSLTSLDRMFIKGKGDIYFYIDTVDNKDAQNRLIQEKKSILNINSPIEVETYLDIFARIEVIILQSDNIPSTYIRGMYMDILYHIISLLRNDRLDIMDIMGETFNPIVYIESPATMCILNMNMGRLLNNIKTYYSNRIKGNEAGIIASIQKYIHAHIGDKISLDDIAAVVHMSTSYTSRFYKKETGRNMQEYIVWAKVEKSKEMLRLNHSLNETIEYVGFASESHFFKVFKTVTGVSPKQYRDRVTGK